MAGYSLGQSTRRGIVKAAAAIGGAAILPGLRIP